MKRKRNSRPVRWQGRTIGRIEGRTFCKVVTRARHMLRAVEGGAYAVQSSVLGDLLEAGVQEIVVIERDTGLTCRATLRDFLVKGIPVNLGFGPQTALPLKYWRVAEASRPEIEQLAMF